MANDCKCGHGKKEHEYNRDARAFVGKCRHKDELRPCGCQGFREPNFFKDWAELIDNMDLRRGEF